MAAVEATIARLSCLVARSRDPLEWGKGVAWLYAVAMGMAFAVVAEEEIGPSCLVARSHNPRGRVACCEESNTFEPNL